MPKEITHIHFSEKTAKELNNREKGFLSSLLLKHSSYLHFGSIAVDTFYYNLKFPFEKDYFQWGDIVHGAEGEDTSLPIIEMLDEIKREYPSEPAEKKLAFTCGFLTHMAMDINFHPYVYYFSGNYFDPDPHEQVNAQMRHRIIESWIDLMVLRNTSQQLEQYISLDLIQKNKETNLELLKFLGRSCSKAWKINNDLFPALKKGYNLQMMMAGELFKSKSFYGLARTLNNYMENKLRAYLALFYPEYHGEIPESIEYFGSFRHPVTGDEFKGSIYDLLNNALVLSTDFLEAVSEYIFGDWDKNRLKSVLKGYSLDVGMVGVKVHEVKYFSPLNITP